MKHPGSGTRSRGGRLGNGGQEACTLGRDSVGLKGETARDGAEMGGAVASVWGERQATGGVGLRCRTTWGVTYPYEDEGLRREQNERHSDGYTEVSHEADFFFNTEVQKKRTVF